jgi:hypothetical protein
VNPRLILAAVLLGAFGVAPGDDWADEACRPIEQPVFETVDSWAGLTDTPLTRLESQLGGRLVGFFVAGNKLNYRVMDLSPADTAQMAPGDCRYFALQPASRSQRELDALVERVVSAVDSFPDSSAPKGWAVSTEPECNCVVLEGEEFDQPLRERVLAVGERGSVVVRIGSVPNNPMSRGPQLSSSSWGSPRSWPAAQRQAS